MNRDFRKAAYVSCIATSLFTSGCATDQSGPPAVETRTVTVDRPVAVMCVKRSDIPAEPARVAGQLNGQAAHDLDIVSASAIALRQAYREAAALLQGCAK